MSLGCATVENGLVSQVQDKYGVIYGLFDYFQKTATIKQKKDLKHSFEIANKTISNDWIKVNLPKNYIYQKD